jgi:hypothetical protein
MPIVLPHRQWVAATLAGVGVPALLAVLHVALIVANWNSSAGSFSTLALFSPRGSRRVVRFWPLDRFYSRRPRRPVELTLFGSCRWDSPPAPPHRAESARRGPRVLGAQKELLRGGACAAVRDALPSTTRPKDVVNSTGFRE